jgi:hypothetical protein
MGVSSGPDPRRRLLGTLVGAAGIGALDQVVKYAVLNTRPRRKPARQIILAALALGALLFVWSALVGQVVGFDFSRYRSRLLKDLTREYPAREELVISQDIPLRSKVIYSGEFRDLPEDSRRLFAAWAQAMNVPVAPDAFRRELKIQEDGIDYWVPVQEGLVPAMKAELGANETIELYVIYIGQMEGRHVFLVNAFDHEGPHPAHRKR